MAETTVNDFVTVESKKSKNTKKANPYRKIALCKHWMQNKECAFGENCDFAHGEDQLVKVQRMCFNWDNYGKCKTNCRFLHPMVCKVFAESGQCDRTYCSDIHPKKTCREYPDCEYGSKCRFFHPRPPKVEVTEAVESDPPQAAEFPSLTTEPIVRFVPVTPETYAKIVASKKVVYTASEWADAMGQFSQETLAEAADEANEEKSSWSDMCEDEDEDDDEAESD